MLNDIHHVSIYGLDLAGVRSFLDKYFGITPIRLEGFDEGAGDAEESAAALIKPKVAIFPVGPSMLEFMQPRARVGVHWDYIRRNGGKPTVSHICWKLEDISARIKELVSRGAELAELVGTTGEAGVSPHGGYRVMNLFAEESVRGVRFQLAEDLKSTEIEAIETGHMKTRSHMKSFGVATDHRWHDTTETGGMLSHIHHASFQVWGLDYVVDYMNNVFGVQPFKCEEIPSQGLRAASFRFGRTIAQFEEPTKFRNPNANFALWFGSHSGFVGGGVSHVAWAVNDLDRSVAELKKAGAKFVQKAPLMSAHGGYRVIEVLPELSGGMQFQLCEDV
jgi:methylmalonyl-CoA/ethylmalonyl-CoA epimerase